MRILVILSLLVALSATAGICQEPIVKTGDVLVLSAQQLVSASNRLVQDAAAPGGETVEVPDKPGRFVEAFFPQVPAGRYQVTLTAAISKRAAPVALGSMLANSTAQVPAYGTRRSLASDDFAQAGAY